MDDCNLFTILQLCDSGSSCIPFVRSASENANNLEKLINLDSLHNATLLNHVSHRASKQQPIVFGVVCSALKIPTRKTGEMYLFNCLRTILASTVRLGKIGSIQVCERHFKDGKVLYRTTFYNESTGETLSAPLKKPRVKENALPSVFPVCPTYLSSSTSSIRESPSKKRQRLEQVQIEHSIIESLISKQNYDSKTAYDTDQPEPSQSQPILEKSTVSPNPTKPSTITRYGRTV
ncbi:hypothetical protein HNY73_005816 [Argiope bruennichi]|uniref:THAP-type domain-containing protein n=1 Tax=Argiope bruennichi TaxID=94029 RepID=A0A8T0FQ65_ARGBR|nr:hypothetical protein HNY73_005816 [Argiope bruennichi]